MQNKYFEFFHYVNFIYFASSFSINLDFLYKNQFIYIFTFQLISKLKKKPQIFFKVFANLDIKILVHNLIKFSKD